MNFNHILWVPGLLRIDHCTLYQCQCVSFSLRFSSPLVFLFFSLPFLFLLSSIHSPFFFFPSSVSSSPLLLLFLLLLYAHNLSTTHHTSLCQGGSKKNTPGTRPRHHPQPTPNSTTLHSTIPNDILSLSPFLSLIQLNTKLNNSSRHRVILPTFTLFPLATTSLSLHPPLSPTPCSALFHTIFSHNRGRE